MPAIVALVVVPALAGAAGDAQRGAKLFAQCMACHSTKPGEHLTGPSLAHAWARKAATAEGFHRYSEALRSSGLVWDEKTLDEWLANPEALVPGTSMTFAGLKDAKARANLVAYLRSVAEGGAPPPARGGMSSRRPDLKGAPPRARVTGVKHCGDTYTVTTADGQAQKFWEFNLRLKTDSSEQGPKPGEPVVIGAGMQGDRASLVFADPAEISPFIKRTCP